VRDWNVIISIYQDGFRRVIHALKDLGTVERSPYYNVLVMKADHAIGLLESVERKTEESPALYDAISRVAPAMRNFEFGSADEFKEKAGSMLREWSQRLAGRSFHVRLHRRGASHGLKTSDVKLCATIASPMVSSGLGFGIAQKCKSDQRRSSLRSCASGRVLSTSSAVSHPRRA
jgi:tRNA(Ser,Leu) C12 N-acetylase TAN1